MISRLQKLGMRKALKELTREELELYCYVNAIHMAKLVEALTNIKSEDFTGFIASASESQITMAEANLVEQLSKKVQEAVQNLVTEHN